ncbi:MAG: alcohol dehydrogenase catalytic domain-containing protein, partial [Verrucomicrobiales bacterium]
MKHYLLVPGSEKNFTLESRESDTPQPAAGEVLVKINAASLNYRDLLMLQGASGSGGDDPVIPLSDGAGEITALGEGVSEWKVGDRVTPTFFRDWQDGPFSMAYHKAARGGSCDGVLSQYLTAPAHSLTRT